MKFNGKPFVRVAYARQNDYKLFLDLIYNFYPN